MSLRNSNIEWKVEAANWTEIVLAPSDCHPIEVATLAIEKLYKLKNIFHITNSNYILGLGVILLVSNTEMKSADEIFVCHVPTVLANAGHHNDSRFLQNLIDNITKSS
jgi:hypothetical protein